MDSIVSRELVDGLGAGAVAACGAAGAYFVVRPRHTLAVGGLLFALAGVVALGWWRGVPTALAVGLAGVAGATAIVGWARLPLWSAAIAVLPFAWLIAERGGLPHVGWVRVVAIVVICVVGLLAAVGDDVSSALATGPILLAITTAGVYVCTPDTEEVRTLLGVALALMILGWPLRWIRLGRAGAVERGRAADVGCGRRRARPPVNLSGCSRVHRNPGHYAVRRRIAAIPARGLRDRCPRGADRNHGRRDENICCAPSVAEGTEGCSCAKRRTGRKRAYDPRGVAVAVVLAFPEATKRWMCGARGRPAKASRAASA